MKTKILIMFLAIGLVACGKKDSQPLPLISDAQCVDAEKILTLSGASQIPSSIVLDDHVEYQMTSSCAAHLQTALASAY